MLGAGGWERDGCSSCQASCCCSSVAVAVIYHQAIDYCLGCLQLLNQAKAMRQQVSATAAAAAQQQWDKVTEEGKSAAADNVPSNSRLQCIATTNALLHNRNFRASNLFS
jgi:hypothetical protein